MRRVTKSAVIERLSSQTYLRDRAEVSNLNLGFKLETTFFVSFTPVVSAFVY